MVFPSTLALALLGGVLPALLWLWFWLYEDRRCPEPRGLILLSFIAGMLAVLIVIPIERALATAASGTALLWLWAAAEEGMKFIAAHFAVLRRKDLNEPVDAVIYMITIALGFAALENALFLLSPIGNGLLLESVLTGNLRFLGATLVHTLSSATVGLAMALVFYRGHRARDIAAALALILATALHAWFNFSIITFTGTNSGVLNIFISLWVGVIILILLFEKIKTLKRPAWFTNAKA